MLGETLKANLIVLQNCDAVCRIHACMQAIILWGARPSSQNIGGARPPPPPLPTPIYSYSTDTVPME